MSRKIFASESNVSSHHGNITGQTIGNKQALDIASVDLSIIIDEASATITYIGKAPVGSLASDAVWKIMKIDESSGTVITYADGNSNFDNVWNNRASLTYI